ncbi:hypothetical protein MC885_020452 [Smutsia gigantea]|nr:hypothetical protein MC885_020452 [Smutsia gigantea]
MGDKRSPTRPKRQPKPAADKGYWDCSVCTFRNGAEAFKCMMCDVRKGTPTRKPRPVSQLVAQQRCFCESAQAERLRLRRHREGSVQVIFAPRRSLRHPCLQNIAHKATFSKLLW